MLRVTNVEKNLRDLQNLRENLATDYKIKMIKKICENLLICGKKTNLQNLREKNLATDL
jgi:NH3-dependent NAD+ synthetase